MGAIGTSFNDIYKPYEVSARCLRGIFRARCGRILARVMTRLVPNPWHKEAEAAEKSALQMRRMVVDEEDGCYIPAWSPACSRWS